MNHDPHPDAAKKIESILLVSARPVGLKALTSITGLPAPEIRSALSGLQERYCARTSGIVLREVAGGYQLATNPECAPVVDRFREEARPTQLSNAAHEILSCALYLGPLTRGEISAVRGVNSDAVVRNLLDRGLLVEAGSHRDAPGAPSLLDVTEEFLAATGASSREDFPALDSLVGPEEIARVRERVGAATDGDTAREPDPESL